VKSDNLTWKVPLERRITIIRGDNGIGKTTMANYIEAAASPMNNAIEVISQLVPIVVTKMSWKSLMTTESNKILIFDDLEDVASSEFASLVKNTEKSGNYYLILARERLGFSKLNQLSIVVSSILRFVTSNDGYKHYTEPYYKVYSHNASGINCNSFLIEDKSARKQLFTKIFNKDIVYSASKGRNTIVSDTKNILDDDTEGNVVLLVLADMAAFGCGMDDLYAMSRIYGNKLYFDSKYECLEELLISTNYFKNNTEVQKELSDIESYANNFISWETYYEKLLERVTNGVSGVEYKHSHKLKTCWVTDCNVCGQGVYIACSMKSDDVDKIKWLFKGTKYDKLLILRDNLE
jgi:hypothetical protein